MARPMRESTKTTKDFSERLSTLVEERKEQGYLQKDIAAGIGVASGTLSDWCSDNKTPTIDAVSKIASYFGVSVEWLFGLSEDRSVRSSTVDELGLSVEAICALRNLTENEKLFLNKLLEDRKSLYFIANGYVDLVRSKSIDRAISSGLVEDDFGPDTLEVKNKLDYARFTLYNRFMRFVD